MSSGAVEIGARLLGQIGAKLNGGSFRRRTSSPIGGGPGREIDRERGIPQAVFDSRKADLP